MPQRLACVRYEALSRAKEDEEGSLVRARETHYARRDKPSARTVLRTAGTTRGQDKRQAAHTPGAQAERLEALRGDDVSSLRSAGDAGLTGLALDDDVEIAVLDDVVGVRDHEHLAELPVSEL